ncbi:hypothetical protein Tco_0677417 [Tanacetum coccineum]|uniref:Reverse transcriptase domain-containing protein n=1 Tax=Tanacetum coccineum TaxID=301880 RepID=A0ABQ4XCZ7_9ASTR
MLDLLRYWKRLEPLLTSLNFPQELNRVHNTFHVSNLKKCYADEPLALPLDGLHIDDKLHFVEEPVEIMDHSEDSTVTYMAVSIPFGGLSDIGSLGVDGPPVIPEDPYVYVVAAFLAQPSPNYVPGPEYPPLPEFVPESVYQKFMPPKDDVLPAEEQPLPAAVSPTADSSGYVLESDPEEDPKEDDNKDPEEDPTDYPTDRDDDDEEEEEPFRDEADDEEEDGDDEEISIRPQTPVSLPLDTKVARLLAIPTPPSSPLSLWSSPLPQIPLPPLPVSPPPPASPTYPLGY